jgi:hypothetical protein
LPRRPKGRGVYGGLIALLVLVAFIVQFKWMQHAKETGAISLDSQGLASKLSLWMLQKKGLDAEAGAVDISGAQKIACETCMGTGSVLSGKGEKEICPICLGVGFHMVRRFDPSDRICPFCVGMGRAVMPDTGAVDTCPRCGGRGLVRSQAGTNAAPDGN